LEIQSEQKNAEREKIALEKKELEQPDLTEEDRDEIKQKIKQNEKERKEFDDETSFERKLRMAKDIMNDKNNDVLGEDQIESSEEATIFAQKFYQDKILEKALKENLNELVKSCESAVAQKLRHLSPEQRSKSKETNYKDLLNDIPEHKKISKIINEIKDITPKSTEVVFKTIDKELTKQRSDLKKIIEELKLKEVKNKGEKEKKKGR